MSPLLDALLHVVGRGRPHPDPDPDLRSPPIVTDPAVGALVVLDRRLSSAPAGVPLSVVNSGGAGGLLSLAHRVPDLSVVAVQSAARDVDDVAGAATRIVTAAVGLDPDVDLYVGLPDVPGWQRAIAVVEAAGHYAQVVGGLDPGATTGQLSDLIEADLPFKVSGLAADQILPLLLAVHQLVEGAGPVAAGATLARTDLAAIAATIHGWDETTHTRIRRRLRAFDTPDPVRSLASLHSTGCGTV